MPFSTSLVARFCAAKEVGQCRVDGQPTPATKPGKVEPWGRIEAFELPFANPNGVFLDSDERRQRPKWFFENATEATVERFLSSIDLPRVHKKFLLDKRYWNVTSNGETISIMSLLPPSARLRLYTYPDAWQDTTVTNQDCFYSALNFFNETEDTNPLNPACLQKVLDSEYAAITENPSFGDLMVLLNPDAKGVHACVYIAENFVFTKNGMNPGQPWVLMRLPDILPTYFAPGKPGRILCLRHKCRVQTVELHLFR